MHVKAAEERLRQAEQQTSPSSDAPPKYAKQQAALADRGELALPAAEVATADERQAQLRSIASDLLYWKGVFGRSGFLSGAAASSFSWLKPDASNTSQPVPLPYVFLFHLAQDRDPELASSYR